MLKKCASRIYMVLIFAFLYLPIIVLIALSFNDSRSKVKWGGFTLRWYTGCFQDEKIMTAFVTTLQVTFLSAIISTLIGTLPLHFLQPPLPRTVPFPIFFFQYFASVVQYIVSLFLCLLLLFSCGEHMRYLENISYLIMSGLSTSVTRSSYPTCLLFLTSCSSCGSSILYMYFSTNRWCLLLLFTAFGIGIYLLFIFPFLAGAFMSRPHVLQTVSLDTFTSNSEAYAYIFLVLLFPPFFSLPAII